MMFWTFFVWFIGNASRPVDKGHVSVYIRSNGLGVSPIRPLQLVPRPNNIQLVPTLLTTPSPLLTARVVSMHS